MMPFLLKVLNKGGESPLPILPSKQIPKRESLKTKDLKEASDIISDKLMDIVKRSLPQKANQEKK